MRERSNSSVGRSPSSKQDLGIPSIDLGNNSDCSATGIEEEDDTFFDEKIGQ
jgi:hypothetical protein